MKKHSYVSLPMKMVCDALTEIKNDFISNFLNFN